MREPVKRATTFLGFVVIITAVLSVFFVEKVNWQDAAIGSCIGIILIYMKDNSIKDIIMTYIGKKEEL